MRDSSFLDGSKYGGCGHESLSSGGRMALAFADMCHSLAVFPM